MSVIWDRDTYAKAYRYPHPTIPGETITYGRLWADTVERGLFYARRLSIIEQAVPSFSRNDHVLIVGCGFGYMIKRILDLGAVNVWGTDISPFIQAEKATEAHPGIAQRILDIDVTDPDAADQFKAAGAGLPKGLFDHVVTPFVIESFDPVGNLAEFTAFLDGLDALRRPGKTTVIHLFAGRLPPPYDQGHDTELSMTWLTLEEWVPYVNQPAVRDHYLIDIHGPRVTRSDL